MILLQTVERNTKLITLLLNSYLPRRRSVWENLNRGHHAVQIERSEDCTSDQGQDSPIQIDLARLIRCLLYGQTRNQKDIKINNKLFYLFPCTGSSI